MDLFEEKRVHPMLIGANSEPFDNANYIFELKLDGERCIAYLDPKHGTDLRNKRNLKMLPKVPELSELHKHVKARCILDGELFILRDGKPDFSLIQARSLMSNAFKISLRSKEFPASFTAFDILYYKDHIVTDMPLTERKKLLKKAVKSESNRFAVSREVIGNGSAFFVAAKQQNLEGVVGKLKSSLYYQGKRTKDWIKIKNLQDEDFVVCGYLFKENNMISIILGQYDSNNLEYKGHVTLGVGGANFQKIKALPSVPPLFEPIPKGNEDAHWVYPKLVCVVKYMEKTASGSMRQPVFKGLRDDKEPLECKI